MSADDLSEVVRPASVEELAAALRDTSGVVAVRGRGTKRRWGARPASHDIAVDLTGLDAIVAHDVGDLVVTVQAGVTLRALQEQVGAHRQWLALDPPESDGTVGGTLATANSGPRRLRFGTPRDLLLGVTVVLADGTIARSGGKVVKNVAGYDLGKLFTGSYGTLGVVAQATLRLHPTFVARRVVSVPTRAPWPLVHAVLTSTATPTAIEWYDDTVHVLVESSEAAVDAQAEQVAGLVGGSVGADVPPGFADRPGGGAMLLKLTFRLSALDDVIAAVRTRLPSATLRAHAGGGVLWASAPPDADAVAELRDVVAAYDGTGVVVDAPDDVKATLDAWGPVRGLAVMQRVKEQFDPQHRMNAGVFVGGI